VDLRGEIIDPSPFLAGYFHNKRLSQQRDSSNEGPEGDSMRVRYLLTSLICLSSLQDCEGGENSTTIADYPRYGTEVSSLPPFIQTELTAFAATLVAPALGGQKVDVMVIGHADFDTKGRDFEVEVSRERAASAERAVEAIFARLAAALPSEQRSLVHFAAIGVGTQRPVFPSPSNEEQRKANRRVELVTTSGPASPPDPRATFDKCIRILANAGPPGPARRMTCVCNNFLQQQPPFIKDYAYDFRAAVLARAGAGDMSSFTREQMSALYRSFMFFVRPQVAKSASGTDADFKNALVAIDDNIGRNLNDFLTQADLGAGLFERIVSVDIVKRMQDPNHIYSCYAGYSRQDPNR
jgi:outer membrane protein OmpA-like peptidoglycan-associated protein